MGSTTKKSTTAKTTSKSAAARSAKGSEAATKSAAAKGAEAVTKRAAAKGSEAASKAAAAKKSEAASKTATGKNDAARQASANAAPKPKTAEPTLVGKPQPVVLGPVMRKKELIEAVVARSGQKKKDAKPVIEGMLAVLGEALAEGRELILPPLGKVLVRKEKKLPNGKVMVVKVRQSKPPITADPKPFPDAAE